MTHVDELVSDGTIFARHRLPEEHEILRTFGPREADGDNICLACGERFRAGDYSILVSLGPGDDEEEQAKAREHRWYNAVAVEIHLACATGLQPSDV